VADDRVEWFLAHITLTPGKNNPTILFLSLVGLQSILDVVRRKKKITNITSVFPWFDISDIVPKIYGSDLVS
jgi:hypothetical protein